MKSLLSVLICFIFLASLKAASSDITFGDWTVTPQSGSALFSLRYKGKPVLDSSSYVVYTPDYKKKTFFLNGKPSRSPDLSLLTWSKETPEGQATLTMKLRPQSVDITLVSTIRQIAPNELGFLIPTSSFRNRNGFLSGRRDGTFFTITDAPFASKSMTSLLLMTPEQDHTLINRSPEHVNFVLQDKRKQNRAIRFITAYKPPSGHTTTVRLSWQVRNYSKQEATLRALAYSTPTVRTTILNVSNPGFEQGFQAWRPGSNAILDHTVRHTGKTAARLTVTDPLKDPVYITRKIPITPGARYRGTCFVKTKDVTPAKGRMSSVGAGLIIEWSDKNGNWINAGSYACNLFGTRDWQKVHCDNLRAPDKAGHAEIFLALRGKGTAWFDDLTLTEMSVSVEKVSPLPGETIETNTPRLTWNPLRGAGDYTVRLSSSPDFLPQNTITLKGLKGTSHQVQNPLAPDTWYWKVEAPGAPDVQTWSFTHHVPMDRDCLPPVISFQAQRILTSQTPLIIPVADQKGQKPAVTIHLGKQGLQPTHWLPPSFPLGKSNFHTLFQPSFMPKEGWPRGFSTLTIKATDTAGNTSVKQAWLLNAPPPPNPVTIDRNGRYASHGRPFFPLGIYEVTQKDMLDVRKAGFDCVHTYRWESSRDDAGCRRYLDDCWNANQLRAFIGFQRSAICNGDFAVIAQRVGAIADHPGLFCWYLFDEPEIPAQYVSPTLLTQFADLIRTLDPFHAVVMTTWGKGMNRYRKTWDTHWTQAYQKPAGVIRQLDEHRKCLLNQSPITLLIHCYDKEQTLNYRLTGKADTKNFKPDYDWLRCAAFAGITQNVNGLWWWWFAKYSRTFVTAASIPHAWDNVTRVIRELKSYQKFLDATPTAPNNGRIKVGDALIVWCVKETPDQKLVVIANTGETPVTFKLNIDDSLPPFKLTLKRFGVHTEVFTN